MKLTKAEKNILVALFNASNGLFLFTLHRQLNLSPKEIFFAIEKLKDNNLITVLEDRANITKEGISFAIENTINGPKAPVDISIAIESFIGPKIEINSFYIPRNFSQ